MLETLTLCPFCNSARFNSILKVKDFTVSRETFQLQECSQCGLIFTNPRPYPEHIGDYYKSEEYISHTNSQKGLVNKLYQQARRIALKKKLRLIQRYCKKGKLLDIGCGTGEFLGYCQQNGFTCTGIEPDASARELAKKNHNLEVFAPEELEKLPAESYDIISMWHVLEHVFDVNKVIKTLFRLLKGNSYCIIAVPNPESHDAHKYAEGWAAYDVPRHLFHYKPSFLKSAFKSHGFDIIQTFPMPLDSYYVSLLSEKYKSGGVGVGVLFRAFLEGLNSNLKAAGPENYSSVIYVFRKPASAK